MDKTKVKNICMGSIYADDFETCFKFYNNLLGLSDSSPMGKKSCYFEIGKQGIYLVGGYSRVAADEKNSRTTFTFEVDSAIDMFNKLKEENVKIIQNEPMKMTDEPETYWFQCFDPSDNIVEFLGGK